MPAESLLQRQAESVVVPALALRLRGAAAALDVSERTLWAWTAAGEGPPVVRRGGCVLYPVDGLRAWLAEQVK